MLLKTITGVASTSFEVSKPIAGLQLVQKHLASGAEFNDLFEGSVEIQRTTKDGGQDTPIPTIRLRDLVEISVFGEGVCYADLQDTAPENNSARAVFADLTPSVGALPLSATSTLEVTFTGLSVGSIYEVYGLDCPPDPNAKPYRYNQFTIVENTKEFAFPNGGLIAIDGDIDYMQLQFANGAGQKISNEELTTMQYVLNDISFVLSKPAGVKEVGYGYVNLRILSLPAGSSVVVYAQSSNPVVILRNE